MKKMLILATSPFLNDGMTKIMMDVYRYNRSDLNIEFATSFCEENKFIDEIKGNEDSINKLKTKKHPLVYMISIWSLIRKNDYDVIYIHGNSAMMFIEALPCKLGGAKRIIVHCHNTRTRHPMFHYLFKPVLSLITDERIGCSKLAAKWAFCGTKYRVILNGVDTDRLHFDSLIRNNTREELGWQNNFVIGHVGRFNYQKNHTFLIDIFKEVIAFKPDARLLLIGEGELKDEIYEKVKIMGLEKYVNFFGTTKHIENYYQAMDVLVLPSLFEGLCLVALEAQCTGLPTILADNVSSESFVTPVAYSLSLDRGSKNWAKQICQIENINRRDFVDCFKEKQLDFETMMRKIKAIIVGIN